jgi:TRAP-type C4-dicarboxylate transport system permease small subunit
VAFSGAVVIGFSMPLTSYVRQHIFVDFFILKFSQKVRDIFNTATRCLVLALFLLIGWNMFKYARDLQKSGEVSLTLQMPFYPVAYGVGVCCFILCLVFVCDIIKIFKGEYEDV